MNKAYWVLMLVAMMVWGCTGCGNGGRVDPRLAAIDSIVDRDSVAAWQQLQAIDSAALTTEADRALYALLHQQLRYKQYLPLDTTVLATLREYYANKADYSHLVYTMILTGSYFEDLHLYEKAITWYKNAEFLADTADYRNLAQINMRLGFIYYDNYSDHHIVKQKFERASHYYELEGDTGHLAVALDYLGGIYRTIKHDKAHATLKRAATCASSSGDEITFVASNEKLARCLLNDSLPGEALTIIKTCEQHPMNLQVANDCYYTAAQALAMLGKPSEALTYYKKVTPPTDTYSRHMKAQTLRAIAQAQGDHALALKYSHETTRCADSLMNATVISTIFETERKMDERSIITLRTSGRSMGIKILVLGGAISLLIVSFLFMIYYRNRAHKRQMDALKQEIDLQAIELLSNHSKTSAVVEEKKALALKLKELETQLRQQQDTSNRFLLQYVSYIRSLMALENKSNPIEFKKEFQRLSATYADDEQFWDEIHKYANLKTAGVAATWKHAFPKLSRRDIKFMELSVAGFKYTEVAFMLNLTPQSISVHRERIAKKMELDVTLRQYLEDLMEEARAQEE